MGPAPLDGSTDRRSSCSQETHCCRQERRFLPVLSPSLCLLLSVACRYQHNPEHDHYEFGYRRGNEHHFQERYEKAAPHAGHFKTKVRPLVHASNCRLLGESFLGESDHAFIPPHGFVTAVFPLYHNYAGRYLMSQVYLINTTFPKPPVTRDVMWFVIIKVTDTCVFIFDSVAGIGFEPEKPLTLKYYHSFIV